MALLSPAIAQLPIPLQIGPNDSFDEAFWAQAMSYLITRISKLEAFEPSWTSAVDTLTQVGLQRLNEQLLPVYESLIALANLGAIFQATSASPHAITTGPIGFQIDDTQKGTFAPTGYLLMASSANVNNSMLGKLLDYDRDTGVLQVNVLEAVGSGTHSDWLIMPSTPPMLPATVLDGGSDGNNAITLAPYVFTSNEQTSALADQVAVIDTALSGSIRSKWLTALNNLKAGSIQDLATNIPDSPAGPIWLAFNDPFVNPGNALATFVQGRYSLTNAQMTTLFATAGTVVIQPQ